MKIYLNVLCGRSAFAVIASLLMILSSLVAQTSRGTISGIVTDQTGATVGGAAVEIVNDATNVSRSTTSNESGLYRFDAVDPGTYTLSVKQPGFTTFVIRNVNASAGQISAVDAQLEVGNTQTTVEVVASPELLQTEAPVRGGTITTNQIRELPFANRDAVQSLALTLPGVTTNTHGFGVGTFVVNGARSRSNNFLIDGVDNNDTGVAGQGFQFTMLDAVDSVHVQTSNFDAEYGRAGGAVVNTITKSGTNNFHGSLHYLIDSTFDDTVTSTQAQSDPEVQRRGRMRPGTEQWYGVTFGGPIIKDRLFFFGGWQDQRQRSAGTQTLSVPSESGFQTLQSLFPPGTSKNWDLYRELLGDLRAVGQFNDVVLGPGRPAAQFGAGSYGYAQDLLDRQWLIRIDHRLTDYDQLSGRYISGDADESPSTANYPGLLTSQQQDLRSAQISWTHIFSPSFTNEFRPAYTRSAFVFPVNTEKEIGRSLPRYTLGGGVSSLGVQTNIPQGRTANNYTIQDTFTYLRGTHSFRGGIELFQQRGADIAPARERGEITYTASTGYSIFANFLDDFGGSNGGTMRDFGSYVNYPRYTRQAYFFQDRWRATQGLTLTLGVRYEYFGTPMNALQYAAYGGLFNVDPITGNGPWNTPSQVKADKNNWAPVVGIAYSPDAQDGFFGWLFGPRGRSVIRTGYQIGYDSFFNNILSNSATSAPNIIATSLPFPDQSGGRGQANISAQLPTVAGTIGPNQTQVLVPGDLVNPYYQRWSFGIQRELPWGLVADASYVGSKGTKLFINEDLNPVVPASMRIRPANSVLPVTNRLDNQQGYRLTRTNGGDSNYHALQTHLRRRFGDNLGFSMAYTWSKLIDNASEVFGVAETGAPQQTAVPSIYGGLTFDRGISSFDRTHRLVFTYVYELPFLRSQQGVLGRILGGWQLSGVTEFQSGIPVNVTNGLDADGIGSNFDRPDFNPRGKPGTRAIPATAANPSPTGYINPDNNNQPIDPSEVRYIGLPTNSGRTGNAGRNLERFPWINNWDANLQKTVRITEGTSLQFRWEVYNVFNHPQYGYEGPSPFHPTPTGIGRTVFTSPAGQFLDPRFDDGGGRVLRYQVRFVF